MHSGQRHRLRRRWASRPPRRAATHIVERNLTRPRRSSSGCSSLVQHDRRPFPRAGVAALLAVLAADRLRLTPARQPAVKLPESRGKLIRVAVSQLPAKGAGSGKVVFFLSAAVSRALGALPARQGRRCGGFRSATSRPSLRDPQAPAGRCELRPTERESTSWSRPRVARWTARPTCAAPTRETADRADYQALIAPELEAPAGGGRWRPSAHPNARGGRGRVQSGAEADLAPCRESPSASPSRTTRSSPTALACSSLVARPRPGRLPWQRPHPTRASSASSTRSPQAEAQRDSDRVGR